MACRELFLKGGVMVSASGPGRERFLNIAVQRGFRIFNVCEPEKDVISFWTTADDFKKMKPAAKKAGVRLFMKRKYGLPFFLYRNRKRKLLAAGFLSFFLLLYGMTFYIWDISFEGNLKFTDEMLLHYMETIPVSYGMKKSDISCETLEGAIRNHFTEITWVSAEIRGTRLIVRIKENEAVLDPPETDQTPCDLCASKDGVITRCIVRSGILKVKEGDEVKTGDLLVDGTIPIYDDSETLVNSHEVHADAEIYAKTTYTTKIRLPMTRTVKSRTGNIRYGCFLRIFDRTFSLLMPVYGEETWEFVCEEGQLKLFEDFYLPVYGGRIRAYEHVPYEKTYTDQEVEAARNRYMDEYMEKLSEKGIQIIGNDGKIEKDESGWKIGGTLTVIENIAGQVPVPEKQEENQTVNEFN